MRIFRDWSPAGASQQQLSVVTTVWGVSTSTQSGPHYPGSTSQQTNTGYTQITKQNNYNGSYRQSVNGWVYI